jgi:RNA polymerase subunit RPABC4/transcription elongation factor Spt4
MFCKNCGKALQGTPEYCPNCGSKPLTSHAFCQNCGAAITPATEICIKCGARVGGIAVSQGGKSKVVSVLLAVFLTYWSWLYTYKKDAWKFWTGLALSIANVILIFASLGFWVFFAWIISGGLWLWAVIDTAIKSDEWYKTY